MLSFLRRPGGLAALHRLDKYPHCRPHVAGLRNFFAHTDPQDLILAHPRQLAEQLGISARDALCLVTTAAHEKLLSITWLLRCPACGGFDTSAAHQHLGDYTHDLIACPNCGNEFHATTDETLYTFFTPASTVVRLPAQFDTERFGEQVQTWGLVPAADMLSIEQFRTYLADFNLPDGTTIGVQSQTFWFTDLLASTAMYEQIGDVNAYDLVRRHYEIIFEAAESNRGFAVKTIGDGTMGNFRQPADALRAAIQAVRGIADLGRMANWPLCVRLGLHAGPAIAVALNNRLDFFGTTVNQTARLERLATGSDIVLSAAIMSDRQVRALAEASGPLSYEAVALAGMTSISHIYRLRLQGIAGSTPP